MKRHTINANELTPRASWYFVAILFIVLGPIWAAWSLQSIFSRDNFTHTIPYNTSMASIHVDQPGTYTMWSQEVHAGTYESHKSWSYSNRSEGHYSSSGPSSRTVTTQKTEPEGLSDLDYRAFDGDKELALTPRSRPWLTLQGDERHFQLYFAIADIEFPRPGSYTIKAKHPNDEQYVFSQPTATQLYHEVWFQLALLVFSVFFGPILFFITYLARRSNYRMMQTKVYSYISEYKAISSFATSRFMVHISALIGFVFPFGNVILPQVVTKFVQVKSTIPSREIVEKNFILDCNRVAIINFQLSFIVYMLLNLFLVIALTPILISGFFVLIFLNIVLTVFGAVFSYANGLFLYPFSIQFIKDRTF